MKYYITQSGFGFLLESRKQRKAAKKSGQAWVSRRRNRESTPFLAQVHKALSTGVGPIDKKTGKIQDLSQWQGHAAQEGKKSTGTIDVIGNPAHRRAALQSGRESRYCVGTACKELVGQFAHETTKDLSKSAANRQSRQEYRGSDPNPGVTKEKLMRDRPDQPKGSKRTPK